MKLSDTTLKIMNKTWIFDLKLLYYFCLNQTPPILKESPYTNEQYYQLLDYCIAHNKVYGDLSEEEEKEATSNG